MNAFRSWNWALLDQAVVSGSNFALSLLLVRYLGFEEYGVYVLVWMVAQFSAALQHALIIAPMMSAPPRGITQISNFFSLQLTFSLSSVVVITIFSTAIADVVIGQGSAGLFSILAITSGASQIQDFFRRSLFACGRRHHALWIDLIAYGLQPLAVVLATVVVSPDAFGALMGVTAAMTLSSLAGWFLLRPIFSAQLIERALIENWRSSRWLLGSTILQWFTGNYFYLAAASALGAGPVGAIRASQNVIGISHVLFQALENVVPTEAARRYAKSARSMTRYLLRTSGTLVAITGVAVVLIAVVGRPLLTVIYGSAEEIGVLALVWFCPIYVLTALGLPARAGLRTIQETRAIFLSYILCTLFSLLAASELVGRLGAIGVMVGLLCLQIISFVSVITALAYHMKKAG